MPFNPGDKTTATWFPADSPEPQLIAVEVIVLEHEATTEPPAPALYRCQSDMGITLLLPEDDLAPIT